ncbi:two-component system phosphate regulon sensor histidine kinase PhoR [Aminobacter lissarensis]|uniref:histidine kinase n=1 Tax=Aminobacter carboxidus TaxID=376165 RepID=A0A8E1WJ77_9HYPH|nr:ATP-binding protein [Aminobacter lissarensis]MBB6468943.1 two-component system phosphate regulon sensor histidine kinase PhoR [Aminobacter lissarensis]
MAETTTQTKARRTARIGVGRLYQNRWMLAAAILAVLAVRFFGGVSMPFTVATIAALALFALVAPRTPAARRLAEASAIDRSPLDRLSGEKLAAAVADPLIIFDRDGTVVHANAAAETAFGAIRPELPLLLKFRAPEMQALIEAVLAGGGNGQATDYVERVPFERVYRVTASAVGRGTGLFVLAFKDQSEARRIDRMRADFIANASHELRTPLASIAGFVETLRGPARNDPNARDQFLQIMQNQTGRMARLIDDLLSLSRLEMKPYLKPGVRVDLRQTVEAVIASLGPLAGETGVVIERDFADGPFEVHGDRDELFQVFQNLLENACKYGQSGGRVQVKMQRAGQGSEAELEVTVRDFGPGIPEEHIPRVTERFYRVDVETSRAQKGTGLGLSIVKHILTRHGARLSIRSKLGEGAAFTVHFPVA